METDEVENTVKQLCAEASAQRERPKLNNVMIELKELLQKHPDLYRSMGEDTFDALRKVWHL
jgi:hypothetical protein